MIPIERKMALLLNGKKRKGARWGHPLLVEMRG